MDMGLCWLWMWFCLNFSFDFDQFLLIVLYASVAHKKIILANFLDAIYSHFAHSSAAGCEMHRVIARDTVEESFAFADGAFAGFAVAFTTDTGHFYYLLRFRSSGVPPFSRIDCIGGGNKILQLSVSDAIPILRGASGFTKSKRWR